MSESVKFVARIAKRGRDRLVIEIPKKLRRFVPVGKEVEVELRWD